MNAVAPNLTALIGEMVGSKLISHSGSLINLAKYPASTIQILGAEKALFRALKTKGKTPKYGLIFNSTFIGRAGQKNKGRISRYLANKCAIAARLDSFSDVPTSKFGETLKDQMEERLKFLSTGEKPRKNKDAMKEVLDELKEEGLYYTTAGKNGKADKKKKKAKKVESDDESEDEKPKDKKKKKQTKKADTDSEDSEEEKPKKKKDKKRKVRETSDDEEIEEEKPKKKKKKTKA
jgi:nucleolar protein 56